MKKSKPHLWSPDRHFEPPVSKSFVDFEQVDPVPSMSRRNGIGTILLGRMTDEQIAPARVKVLWFTLFFVPLVPIRAYAVTGGMDGYYFHGEMGCWAFLRRYKWRALPFLLTVIVEAATRAILVIALAAVGILCVRWLFGRL